MPRDLSLNEIICVFDPAWWYHLVQTVELPVNSHRTKMEEFSFQLKACVTYHFDSELRAEMDTVTAKQEKAKDKAEAKAPFRRIHSAINDLTVLAEIFAVAVLSNHEHEKIEDLIHVLRNQLFRLMGWRGAHGWVQQALTVCEMLRIP